MDENIYSATGLPKRSKVLIETLFQNSEFPFYNEKDVWQIYLGGDYMNYIAFQFCGDVLCKIHRVREIVELP